MLKKRQLQTHKPEKKQLKKNLSQSKDHSFFLNSLRNDGFEFWFPPSSNHWEGSPNFKQLFILYGLWPWQLSATFWLCFLELKVYFTAATSCLFSDFILVHITPTLQRLNSLTREAERMPTPWPALGVEEETWQILTETSMSTLLSAKPSTLSPPHLIALGPEWGVGQKKKLFPLLYFPTQSPIYSLSQGEKGWVA